MVAVIGPELATGLFALGGVIVALSLPLYPG